MIMRMRSVCPCVRVSVVRVSVVRVSVCPYLHGFWCPCVVLSVNGCNPPHNGRASQLTLTVNQELNLAPTLL